MAKSPHLTRNEFVKTMLGVLGTLMGVVVGLPAIGYLLGPGLKRSTADAWVPLGPIANFKVGLPPTLVSFTRTKVNGWERTTNSYGVYVYRKSDTDTLVLSNVCTHLACRVKWEDPNQIYHCPCHDAEFGPEGQIITGPQKRPMDQLPTKVENDILMVHFTGG
jgi:menaquinol-cytochrome c reductase iron-sulfur subunit